MRQTSRLPDLPTGISVRSYTVGHSPGYRTPWHAHDWHQLVYASQGVLRVRTAHGLWVVPPHRAVWVPRGVEHEVETVGWVWMCSLYFVRGLVHGVAPHVAVVNVSPLLRELILETARLCPITFDAPERARLVEVLLDQLKTLPATPLTLPTPRDPRAVRATKLVEANPGERWSVAHIANRVGASKRTIERLFRAETNMTFGQWRQHFRLLSSLQRLAAGESVTNVALAVGYESPSAYIAMFRQVLGTTPGRYYERRQK